MEDWNDGEGEGREGEQGDGLGFDPIAILEATMAGRTPPESYADDDEGNSLAVLRNDRPRDMPKIDHLGDAVHMQSDGTPAFIVPPGGKVIIERRSSVLNGNPWLDTKLYDVVAVDHTIGLVKLWDPELRHHARDNWFVGLKAGSRYKLPPPRGRWDSPPKVVAAPVSPPPLSPEGEPIKRKRGRPAGVKNRPKDVIVAEKAARAAAKSEKKGRKSK